MSPALPAANQLHQYRRWQLPRPETLTKEINQEENHGKSETEEESGEEGEAQDEAQGKALTFICPVE